ncbi:MAG: 50S ribosomal protein L20 [Anaerolineae bacterium]
MARVKRGVQAHARHVKILKITKGQRGAKHRLFRRANEAMLASLRYATYDRRDRKGEMRKLWILRINAGSRQNGLSYSRFMAGLKAAGVEINRKVLADMAVVDPAAFAKLVEMAKTASI